MRRYFTVEKCFHKMYIANNCRRDCPFVYGFILVLSITYYNMNLVDDCSAYYSVANGCQKRKYNDPIIYGLFSVMHDTYCSQMPMCKS